MDTMESIDEQIERIETLQQLLTDAWSNLQDSMDRCKRDIKNKGLVQVNTYNEYVSEIVSFELFLKTLR